MTLARDGTNLSGSFGQAGINAGNVESFTLFAFDSPATTSSITYSIQFKVDAGGTCVMPTNAINASTANLWLLEIAQ
jgi:hypothetical protein